MVQRRTLAEKFDIEFHPRECQDIAVFFEIKLSLGSRGVTFAREY